MRSTLYQRTFFIVATCLGLLSSVTFAQAYTPFSKPLVLGSTGAAISTLQTVLTTQQVYNGPITGYFGKLTRDGVKTLQAKFGLDPVGTVGPKTRALLNQLLISSTTPATVGTTTAVAAGSNMLATTALTDTTSTSSYDAAAAAIGSTSRTTKHKQGTRTTTIGTTSPVNQTPVPTPAQPTTTPTTTPPKTTPPTTSTLQWGVFPGNASLSSVETLVGKQANIEAVFADFTDSFPTYLGNICSSNPNKTLLVFWENYSYSLDSIIAGTRDDTIRSFAQQTASYPCPVIIAPFHEMNGNWDPWDGTVSGNTPAKVIAAWKHVHDIFAATPVTNVQWAWVVNNDSVPNVTGNQYADYYPGDTYVDYVGVDGFNFGNPWQTFGQVFDTAIAKLQTYNKPIYIFSMASTAGSQKAAWITEGLGSHIKTYANVKGWVWFDMSASDGNWRLDSDPASVAAFTAILP